MKIQTNRTVEDREAFMKKASSLLSSELGKPESYIMIALEDGTDMAFAGSTDPLVYAELKSIGLTSDRTADLSEALCTFFLGEIGVSSERIYVEFTGVPGNMWGWDNRTFG